MSALDSIADRPAWHARAACRGVGPDFMFPTQGEDIEPARAICQACEVRGTCLDFALARKEKFGVWGATSERERRHLRQIRAQEAS